MLSRVVVTMGSCMKRNDRSQRSGAAGMIPVFIRG